MRSLQRPIERDLEEKFVLLAGPRQVGKTHLAKAILKGKEGRYYNWDLAEDRENVLAKSFLQDRFVVLDELHKYERWKGWLKGLYDKYHSHLKILVTGSSRLDVYQRGGDSLFGRYLLHHLHPLSMGEIGHPKKIEKPDTLFIPEGTGVGNRELLNQLFRWGGFPEPFHAGREETHRRWSLQRRELLVREDIRDLSTIQHLTLVEHLLLLLPSRVGSPLSINSLREDLQVAHNTVTAWLETFSRLYIVFMLRPYTAKLQRSIRKERKLYLWDWSQVKDDGARFENLVASHLWKAVQMWRDLGFGDFDLTFLRDRDRREVDFCITKDQHPWLLVEAKFSETQIADPLLYYSNRLQIPAVQIVHREGIDKQVGSIRLISADRWLPRLP